MQNSQNCAKQHKNVITDAMNSTITSFLTASAHTVARDLI